MTIILHCYVRGTLDPDAEGTAPYWLFIVSKGRLCSTTNDQSLHVFLNNFRASPYSEAHVQIWGRAG